MSRGEDERVSEDEARRGCVEEESRMETSGSGDMSEELEKFSRPGRALEA
jgi:hypothetical protein